MGFEQTLMDLWRYEILPGPERPNLQHHWWQSLPLISSIATAMWAKSSQAVDAYKAARMHFPK